MPGPLEEADDLADREQHPVRLQEWHAHHVPEPLRQIEDETVGGFGSCGWRDWAGAQNFQPQ
jgi:hypothetical protein